jgi:hypothetical protein
MIEEVKIGDNTFHLAPIKVRQMKEIAKARQVSPNGVGYLDENIHCVFHCLKNGGTKEIPIDGIMRELSIENIDEMDYGVYSQLLTEAQRISGFVRAQAGENKAS